MIEREPELTEEQREWMRRTQAQLADIAERCAIGIQNTAQAAKSLAEAYAEILRDTWLRDYVVVVVRPYSCPVDRCRWQEDEGTTCPIHLRDLQPTTLDVGITGRAAVVSGTVDISLVRD